MVCTSWIKAAKYNPVTLLQWLNVMDHPTVASTILQIWSEVSNVSPQWFQEDVPEMDQQRFRDGLQNSIAQLTVFDTISNESKGDTEKIFIARNLLQLITSDYEKDALWSQLIPDIPILCQVLETLSLKLVDLVASQMSPDKQNSDEASEHEEQMIFLCLELLQMASIKTSSMEEGSRRLMGSTIKNLLSNAVTPDDLLEGCLTTLKCLLRSDDYHDSGCIDKGILPVIQHLSDIASSSDNELFQIHTSIRIVSLITLTLENRDMTSQPSVEAMECFVNYVRPMMSHENRLLRQAAVRALGLISLVLSSSSESALSNDDFTSELLGIACNDEEDIEIRVQAMFALTDWVMLQFRYSNGITNHSVFESLCSQVDELLRVPTQFNQDTTCCAAEIATKLILALFMDNSADTNEDQAARIRTWLARLVLLYFDTEKLDADGMEDHHDNISQVGHPVRLQQLLSIFFPTLTTTSAMIHSGTYFIESITPMLTMSLQLQKKQKSSKSSAEGIRWIRSIDFVVSIVSKSREMKSELPQSDQQPDALDVTPRVDQDVSSENPTDDKPINEKTIEETITESTPGLIASVQVASFLSENGSIIGVVNRRALCKWISSQSSYLDFDNELWEDLSRFKEILEELVDNDGIDDSSSRRVLEPVLQLLRNVESDIDDVDDVEDASDDDDEVTVSLSDAIDKVKISTDGNENSKSAMIVPSSVKNCIDAAPSNGSSSLNRNQRAQRRLRPSN